MTAKRTTAMAGSWIPPAVPRAVASYHVRGERQSAQRARTRAQSGRHDVSVDVSHQGLQIQIAIHAVEQPAAHVLEKRGPRLDHSAPDQDAARRRRDYQGMQ